MPVLINSCPVDEQFPVEKALATDELLGNGQYKPGYERVHWEGCVHGFAVRGDIVSGRALRVRACDADRSAPFPERPEGEGRQGGRVPVDVRVVPQASARQAVGCVGRRRGLDLNSVLYLCAQRVAILRLQRGSAQAVPHLSNGLA